VKEQEIREILEEVTDEFVRRQADLWPGIEQRIKARRHFRPGPSRWPALRRIGMGAVAATTLLVVVLVQIRRAAPASAAEVMGRAQSSWASRIEGAGIVWERFSVAPAAGGAGLTVEIWRSQDGSQLRYEVVDDPGRPVFLALRDGGEVWRSLHNDTPGHAPVEAILHTSTAQMAVLLDRREASSPLFRSVVYGLADLDGLLVQGRQTCFDLPCLLGVLDLDGDRTKLIGRERTQEGREVYVLGILDRPDQSWSEARHVSIDAESYSLVEYTDIQGSVVRLIERRGLGASDVPEGFFRTIPEGIRVLEIPEGWRPPTSAEIGGTDRVWIVSASPNPDVPLGGGERFAVTVGYELVTAPVTNLYVSLMPACHTDPRVPCAGGVAGAGRVMVAAGTGTETLEFALEPWQLQGDIILAAYLDTGGEVRFFPDYTWRIEIP
jgi:hypothetical protein